MLKLIFILSISALPSFAAKTLVYCSESNPSTFGPQLVADSVTATVTNQIYNNLTELERGTTKVVPSLATWEVSKDGLSYIFHLKKDVSFQKTKYFTPTRKLNADDVIFSFDRQRLKNHPYHRIGGGSYETFNSAGFGELIKSIEKVDDLTVKFVLAQPEGSFVASLTIPFAGIISQEYANQLTAKGTPEKIDLEPVGTGPYLFSSYSKDQTIRYLANPDYFRGKPKIDSLIFSITPEASVRYQKLVAGECQFSSALNVADLPRVKTNSALKVMEQSGLNVGYLALNTEVKPLNNPLVRQAIYHALNRQSYIGAIYMNTAVVNPNPLPVSLWAFDAKIKDYDYNIETAKQLLAQAGHPKGFAIDLWTLPVIRAYNPNGKKMGEMMQSDLAKVGIQVNLKSRDWPSYLAAVRKGEHQMAQFGWSSDSGDPDDFLYNLLSCNALNGGSNQARWCFKPYDDLVRRAKRLTDQTERKTLYERAQVIFHEQVPWVPLVTATSFRAMSKSVTGFKMSVTSEDFFETVDLN